MDNSRAETNGRRATGSRLAQGVLGPGRAAAAVARLPTRGARRSGALAAVNGDEGAGPTTAGFVISATFEVLAWNRLTAALMEDFGALQPADRNVAHRAFAAAPSGDSLYGLSDADAFRRHVVMELQATAARYPDDPTITGLVDELRAGSDEFARLWTRRDVQVADVLTKTFQHPVVGAVTVDCDSLALTDRDQHLVLYSAPAGSSDADALAFLAVVGASTSVPTE